MKLPAKFAAMFAAALLLASCGDDGGNGPSTGSSEAGSSCSATRSSSAVMPDSAAKCGSDSTFVDARDDRRYRCVTIGTQTWMAENLNYEYKIDGRLYGNFCPNNSVENCAKYGRLYNWGAAMDTLATHCGYKKNCQLQGRKRTRGVCPRGWHLPDSAEWVEMLEVAGDNPGKKLKASSGWEYNGENGNGTDDFGFSVLPAGMGMLADAFVEDYPDSLDAFFEVDMNAFIWTSQEASSWYAYKVDFFHAGAVIAPWCDENGVDGGKWTANAVRCVQD